MKTRHILKKIGYKTRVSLQSSLERKTISTLLCDKDDKKYYPTRNDDRLSIHNR